MTLVKIEPFAVEQVSAERQVVLGNIVALPTRCCSPCNIRDLQCSLTVLWLFEELPHGACSPARLSMKRAMALSLQRVFWDVSRTLCAVIVINRPPEEAISHARSLCDH